MLDEYVNTKTMNTILIRYYNPSELGIPEVDMKTLPDSEIKKLCFRVNKYPTSMDALEAYANTTVTWSTLVEDTTNIQEWIDIAYEHIKTQDYEWLEHNFT